MEIQTKTFDCQCGKIFKHAPSLCVHRKKCSTYQEHKIANPNPIKLLIQEKDDVSILSSASDSSLARILELENELKITELKNKYELRLKDQEMEHMLKLKNLELENQELKFSLRLKNLEIEMLNKMVQQPVPQPAPVVIYQQAPAPVVQVPQAPAQVVQVPVQVAAQEKTPKPSTLEFLNNNLDEALTIEDCFEILQNPEHNQYLFEEQFMAKDGNAKNVINPKYSLPKEYSNSSTTNAVDIIAALFIKFEKKELPFYVCRKNKNILYIKTKNGWVKSSEKEADDLLFLFSKKALFSASNSILNTVTIFETATLKFAEIYTNDKMKDNYHMWVFNNKNELMNNLFIFEEDKELTLKKLKTLLLKMDPNNQGED